MSLILLILTAQTKTNTKIIILSNFTLMNLNNTSQIMARKNETTSCLPLILIRQPILLSIEKVHTQIPQRMQVCGRAQLDSLIWSQRNTSTTVSFLNALNIRIII